MSRRHVSREEILKEKKIKEEMKDPNKDKDKKKYPEGANKKIVLFAEYTFKKYKKKYMKEFDWTKKTCKNSYYRALMAHYPEVVNWMLRYGYKKNPEIQQLKEGICAKFTDPWFVKCLTKDLKEGEDIECIKLLPMVLREVLAITSRVNRENLARDPKAAIYKLDDVIELSKLAMGKRLKKMVKAGIDEEIAFNVLSIFPCDEAFSYSPTFRVYQFYEVLYEGSKGKMIPFKEIMETAIKKDRWPMFLVFALLERKEKYSNLTDNQKQFYIQVTNWIFDTLEHSSTEVIRDVLNAYVKGRKQDDAQGKDGNRRYVLSSLSQNDYEKTVKVIKNIILNDPSVEKYFK